MRILNFSIMFEPSHLKSPIQNINNKKIIHKILQSFQRMKVYLFSLIPQTLEVSIIALTIHVIIF